MSGAFPTYIYLYGVAITPRYEARQYQPLTILITIEYITRYSDQCHNGIVFSVIIIVAVRTAY